LKEVKEMLDKAQGLINELRLRNKHSLAQKCLAIYQENCQKTQKIAEEYEVLYKRHIENEAKAKVAESMKKGQIYTVDGSDEEQDEVNKSLKDIQLNPLLTQEQRRTRVEAEVFHHHSPAI
jgi:hypothetical protein